MKKEKYMHDKLYYCECKNEKYLYMKDERRQINMNKSIVA